MSKKTLNESTIRRFMGLANITPAISSNFLKENYMEADEEEEAPADFPPEDDAGLDAAAPEDELPPEPPMDAEMPPEEAGSPELEITQEEAAVLLGVLEKLTAAMPAGDEEAPMEPPMDAEMPPEELDAEAPPEEEMPPEDEMLEAALAETDVELSEDEVVKEVARRVAARILKAKRAKARMDEALGNKKN